MSMYLFHPLHLSLFFPTHTLARTSRNTLAIDTIFSIPRVGKLWHIGQIQLSACSCIIHDPRTFAIDVILETFTLTPLKQNFIPKYNFILFLIDVYFFKTVLYIIFQIVSENDEMCFLYYYEMKVVKVTVSESCVQLFATPWTIQSMEFSRPEYRSRSVNQFSPVRLFATPWTAAR
ncbi:unnamed protein product [Rangifer tarandus platyrhynchus]|uniref:Uncharacterized protein n=2 Tax=Rangifer tarandus platyrhynchus TaxID=3082113 RepID=A0AC59ZM93_RANTA